MGGRETKSSEKEIWSASSEDNDERTNFKNKRNDTNWKRHEKSVGDKTTRLNCRSRAESACKIQNSWKYTLKETTKRKKRISQEYLCHVSPKSKDRVNCANSSTWDTVWDTKHDESISWRADGVITSVWRERGVVICTILSFTGGPYMRTSWSCRARDERILSFTDEFARRAKRNA